VTPGVAPTLHAFDRFRLLIRLLFPVFGNPRKTPIYPMLSKNNDRQTNNANSESSSDILFATVIAKEFHKEISAQTSRRFAKVFASIGNSNSTLGLNRTKMNYYFPSCQYSALTK
jgi:hypothetical protein